MSTWFPGADDPARGRFVADQVAALASAGRVRPLVASFDPVSVGDKRRVAARAGRAIRASSRVAVASHPGVLGSAAWLGAAVGVARLPIPSGESAVGLETRPDRDRALVLEALARRPERRIGLVHAHTADPDGAAGAILADRLGLPLVVTEHASFVARLLAEPASRRRYLAAVRRAARFIAVSESFATELRASIPEIAPKLVVIPNVVAIDDFPLGDAAERQPAELLYVGYRKQTKGIALLLEAFAMVRAERPEATLRLIGGAPSTELDERWHRLAGELGIADAVSFEQAATREDVATAMRRATLFVHPSPRETFGVVAVEALASGLPVVTAASGGVSDIVSATRGGKIVATPEAAEFAGTVLAALADRSGFDPGAVRTTVASLFGPAAVAARLADLYDEVLREAGAPPPYANGGMNPGRAAAETVVLALEPGRAAKRLSTVPEAARSRLDMLAGTSPLEPPSGFRSVTFVDLEAGYVEKLRSAGWRRPPRGGLRRIAWLATHPIATVRRAMLGRRRSDLRIEAARTALTTVLTAHPDPPQLVCIEGFDYLVAEPFVEGGDVVLAPGGVRWLGDR